MQIWIDGSQAAAIPCLSREKKLRRVRVMAARFRWDENLYGFYVNILNAMRGNGSNASEGN